jgi:hypothetical protein
MKTKTDKRVATCIFCPSALDKSTKPEHILHAALGGKKTTRRVLCSDCNNKFGGGIDKVLVEQFAAIRNLLQLPSGAGAPPPMLKRVKSGNDSIDIGRDGKIRLVNKPFTIVNETNGNTRLQITGDSFGKIEAMIPHMAAALKISEERLRELISKTEATFVERRPDPIKLGFAFGGSEAIRSAAKSCLVLWTTLVGNDEVRGGHYEDVRRYINDGDNQFLSERTFLDSRVYEASDRIIAAYGPAFNLIYVKSDRCGRVVGQFTLYNLIAFSVVLAKSGGSPDRQIALVSNPLLTRAWSDRVAAELNVPFEWLDNPDYDYEDMQRSRHRIAAIMEYYIKTTRDKEPNRITEDVLRGHGLKEGEIIPKEMASSISKEISERVIHHLFGRPYKKPIAAAQVRQILGGKPIRSD